MHKNSWEIENIEINMDDELGFLRKFIIYDSSKLIQSKLLNMAKTDDYINAIKQSQIDTGVMISILKINGVLIYLCILDSTIFIIKQANLQEFQEYFNKHLNSLLFMKAQFKEDFMNDLSQNTRFSEQTDQIFKPQKDVNKAISDEIIRCTIKKSQYRTINMRQEPLPNKWNSKNDEFKLNDFFFIKFQGFKLYCNSKYQILNILKFYEDEKRFNHEIDFYHQIENTFPFIRKIFGIIKQPKLSIIILEYVEGECLDEFLLSEKEIDFNTKIRIILEILFSVYYVHSNGLFLRDLKPNNIIIDSQNDAILIDFDSSKEMYPLNEEEYTCDIGSIFFTAIEQQNLESYTYKVDSYY